LFRLPSAFPSTGTAIGVRRSRNEQPERAEP
jgi:hypothetical protein